MTVAPIRPVRAAARDLLVAAGLNIGDGRKDASTTTPYGILWGGTSGGYDGPTADANADADVLIKVTCVGSSQDESEHLADQVLAALCDRAAWAIPGRSVAGDPTVDNVVATPRDDKLGETHPRFGTVVIVRVPTTAA